MKIVRVVGLCLSTLTASALAQDFLDRVDESLTISAFHDNVRARLSGLIDLEFFRIDQPPPGLIDTDEHFLFNPRLTLFLDAQLGSGVYVFVQSRADRGFDPSDDGLQIRLDEYALRITPWEDGRVNLQIGKFATVVGNWVSRHLSWENPFITAPLPYENLTAIWDVQAADSVATLLGWAHVETTPGNFGGDELADKYLRSPIIWGPSYASGISAAGRMGKFEYATEIKNRSLSSHPGAWDATKIQWQHPTFNGRLGFRPNEIWNFGFSASTGTYLRPEAEGTLARGHGLGDYRQIVFGQDISYAWRHLQIWAEFYETRFEIPGVGNADTFAYYVEAKYKFAPQLFGALRWNQQLFSTIGETDSRWGREIWRIDSALGYRFTAHTQLKLQYSFQRENSAPRDFGHLFATQFTVRF